MSMERFFLLSILVLTPCHSSPLLQRVKRTSVSAGLLPFSFPLFGINGVHLNIFPNDIGLQAVALFDFEVEVPEHLAFLIPGQFPE